MPDIELNWPLDLRPGEQSFYIRTLSTKFENPLTGQVQVLERDAARWVTKLSLVRAELDSRRLDALLAALRGSVGHVFVPDFRRSSAKGSLAGSPQLVSGNGKTSVSNPASCTGRGAGASVFASDWRHSGRGQFRQ